MTGAWSPPRRLPVFFDVPADPPAPRIGLRAGMSPLRLALAIIRSGGAIAAVGCLLLILFNTASTLIPLALGAAIDRGIGPVTTGTSTRDALSGFLAWAGVIAGLYVIINLTYRFGGRMGWLCVQRAQYELSARVVERVLDVRGTEGPPQLPGRLLSVATSDTMRACSALYFAIYPIGNLVAVVVAAVTLFAIHPLLGTAVIIGAPVILLVMAVVARPLRRRAEREQAAIADASGTAADLIAGHRVIAGIGARRAAATHYRGISRTALTGALSANRAEAALVGTNAALTGLFAGTVAVLAAALTFHGSITIGQLIAAAGIAQTILQPLRILIEEAATVAAEALASARRLLDLLGLGPDPAATGTRAVPTTPRLRLTSPHLLESLEIRPGEFVAVDPAVVDGDALVAALTLSTPHVDAGTVEVKLDDRPVQEYRADELRRTILVAPHHPDLLEPTVLANAAPPEREEDRAHAVAALHIACCESLEHELPQGYDTPIGDGGRTLSGGQRQRVALARAIARDATVLVLHEPTSSVDSVTELEIAGRVRQARRARTTIVVTSASAFHAVADRSVTSPTTGAMP